MFVFLSRSVALEFVLEPSLIAILTSRPAQTADTLAVSNRMTESNIADRCLI